MTDIQAIIEKMTLEEKAALSIGASNWTTTAIPRLGVPEMFVADGPHGLRRVPQADVMNPPPSIPATCFPTASALAATWNVDLVREVGVALGEECISLKVDVLLGPGANMKRTPLCGRNFEYYGEDPYLAGQLATNMINGIQSQGVGTSLKHYAVNNQEFQRFCISAEVDQRTLREIYLPAFETAVKQAKPWTVMCAYNKINGEYASEHHQLLIDILKEEWGFEGLVVSDWGAVHDRVKSLQGGLDLEMPGPKPLRVQEVIDAIKSGRLTEAQLNDSVRRILEIVFRAAETRKGGEIAVEAHDALARRAAAEGIILLKNNGVLPLQNPQKIAIIGRSAKEPHFQGGGSSHVNALRVALPFDEVQDVTDTDQITYSAGYSADLALDQALIDEATSAAKGAEVALLYIALPNFKESEGYDRNDIDLTVQQVALIKAVSAVQPKTVVILNNGSAVTMSTWIDGVAAVLEGWMMGQAGGGAVADILFGKVSPSGKLTETFPLKLADTPAFLNFPGENGKVQYGEGLFIGYRYYDTKGQPVQFPFGYGLSYTTFEYSNPKVSASMFKDVDGVTVSVDVTNTGKVAGKEVVQVYVHDQQSSLVRPTKELKGFAKVSLEPGETKTVSVPLDSRAFAFYHPGHKQWVTESGAFDILFGSSSADIRAQQTVSLQSTLNLLSLLTPESTIREWLEDTRGRPVFEATFKDSMKQLKMDPNAYARTGEERGSYAMDGIMDMPIRSVIHFREKDLPMPADALIDAMLQQVRG
jgi:beta-glucosidase